MVERSGRSEFDQQRPFGPRGLCPTWVCEATAAWVSPHGVDSGGSVGQPVVPAETGGLSGEVACRDGMQFGPQWVGRHQSRCDPSVRTEVEEVDRERLESKLTRRGGAPAASTAKSNEATGRQASVNSRESGRSNRVLKEELEVVTEFLAARVTAETKVAGRPLGWRRARGLGCLGSRRGRLGHGEREGMPTQERRPTMPTGGRLILENDVGFANMNELGPVATGQGFADQQREDLMTRCFEHSGPTTSENDGYEFEFLDGNHAGFCGSALGLRMQLKGGLRA